MAYKGGASSRALPEWPERVSVVVRASVASRLPHLHLHRPHLILKLLLVVLVGWFLL